MAAHLATAITASVLPFVLRSIRYGSFDRANDEMSRRAARRPVADIVATLRAGADTRFSPPGTGPRAPLTDVLVHSGAPIMTGLNFSGVEPSEVWYVAYGSNLSLERFTCYLTGGRPAGAGRTYPGARDPRPALDVRPVMLTGSVYFALQSLVWGGGMAFLDPAGTGAVAGRGYRLRRGQFADVAAQEMHRDPLADLDLKRVLRRGRWSYGPGRYETIVRLGELDGAPLLTLTAPWGMHDVRHATPSAAYLTVIAAGLRESHGWSGQQVADHLATLPGVLPAWTHERLLDICG